MDYKFAVHIQNQPQQVFPSLARAIQYVREINPMWYQLEKVGPNGYREVLVASTDSWHV